MTEAPLPSSAPEQRRSDTAQSLLATALWRARWSIFWERLWPALAAVAVVVGLFLALSWLGLWLWLPPLGRAVGVLGCVALALATVVPFLFLRMPGARDGLTRLDQGSGVRHRPATTIADELAVTAQDPYSLALWKAHIERARTAARALKAGWPSPRLQRRDPYAIRALILIACVATFFAAGGERWKRIAVAFDWHGVVLPADFRVDAWVTPPVYTGKPPIILPGIHPGVTSAVAADTGPAGSIAVPAGSTLIVRATGQVDLDVSSSGGVTPSKDTASAPAGTEEHRFTITGDGTAKLRGVGDDRTWEFTAIPDKPPTIALTKDPEEQTRGSVLLSYKLEDDYGVTEAKATFARKDDAKEEKDGAPHPLFGPPDFELVLPQARTRNGVGQTLKDLTDHPWAGADVVMTLMARDDGGNVGKSEPFAFRLPERVFTKPLARALIEQRRNLALDARTRPQAITALDALALAPEQFTPDAGIYLGLRSIFWSLVRAKNDDDLRNVVAQLWSMAVDIEDGNMADAQEALRNAEDALRQALQNGASDQEIKQLMDKLREAMDRYMQAMREQLRNSQQLARPLSPDAHVLSQRDLQNMLDKLENLARSGDKDAAQALLQQLEQMMENLQAASPDMNNDDGDDMSSQLDELGDMIRQQQDLRDRTFKQGQNQRQQQQPQPGQRGKSGQPQQPGDSMGDLSQKQQALRDRLNQLLKDLKQRGVGQNQPGQQGQQGQQGQDGQQQGQDGQQQGQQGQQDQQGQQEQQELDQLGRAGNAMGDATNDLGQGDADSAVDSQGQALDALRQGAQSMAQAMQQQMGKGQGRGRLGRLGRMRSDQDTDPLGRPLRGHDYGDDDSVRVPGDIDVQRARRIIEELRKRFSDMGRPQEELDYLDRLLKGY